jgi:hypothetical protein
MSEHTPPLDSFEDETTLSIPELTNLFATFEPELLGSILAQEHISSATDENTLIDTNVLYDPNPSPTLYTTNIKIPYNALQALSSKQNVNSNCTTLLSNIAYTKMYDIVQSALIFRDERNAKTLSLSDVKNTHK